MANTVWALDPRKDLTQLPQSRWGLEQGVVGEFVLAIEQTPDGFLWLGTRSALLRFDGARFSQQVALDPQVLAGERVEALLSEANGRMWIGTDRAVVRFESHKYTLAWRSPDPVHTLAQARDEGVWVGTAKGLRKLLHGQLAAFAGEAFLDGFSIRAVLEEGDGDLWVGTDQGLVHVHNGQPVHVSAPDSPGTKAVRALRKDAQGRLWIGAAGPALHSWHEGRYVNHGFPQASTDGAVTALLEDKQHNLWIGSPLGLARYTADHRFDLFAYDQGLVDPRVSALFIDREDNLWVGTKGGLVMFHDGDFTTLTPRQGLPSSSITTLLSSKGRLLIASADHGVFAWEQGKPLLFPARDGQPVRNVRTLFEDAQGEVWAGSSQGLFRLNNEQLHQVNSQGNNPQPDVGSIAAARGGGLWVGTKGDGLLRYQNGKLAPYLLDRALLGWIRPVYEDRSGRLWLATHDGRLMQANAHGNLTEINVGQARYPRAFYEDDTGMWVGFRGVLARLAGNDWKLWSSRDGLPATSMSQIIEDNAGSLWLGGASGIFQVERKALKAWLAGGGPPPTFRTYGRSDGLLSSECSLQPGTAKTQDGRLWFPTTAGVAVIDPSAPQARATPPRVRILEADVDGHIFPAEDDIAAPPGPGTLSFQFTAPAFRDSEKLRFDYKLEGFDQQWIHAEARRFARYNNIPPGHYRFLVRASHSENRWPYQSAGINLNVQPRLYQTRAFLFGIIVAGVLLALFALRLRQLALSRRHALLQAERTRIARDLHDNLDQSLFAATLQLDLANKMLPEPTRASSHILLARNLLSHFQDEARRSIADLRSQVLEESQGALHEALKTSLERLARDSGIAIDIKVNRGVEKASPRIKNEILRIAQELTTNALRHAEAKHVWVDLTTTSHCLILQVRDDGCGFNPQMVAGAPEGHFGLSGVRERARWLGGEIHIDSHQPGGTTVKLTVPLAPASVNPEQ